MIHNLRRIFEVTCEHKKSYMDEVNEYGILILNVRLKTY